MNEITQLLHIDPLLLQALREDIPEEDVSTNCLLYTSDAADEL